MGEIEEKFIRAFAAKLDILAREASIRAKTQFEIYEERRNTGYVTAAEMHHDHYIVNKISQEVSLNISHALKEALDEIN